MAGRHEDTGISPLAFAVGAVVLILLVGSIIWFAIPGPDARHKFVSPSGKNIVEVGEECRDAACRRVAIREKTNADGSKTRRGCVFEIPEQRPMLINAQPSWAPDEANLTIAYADAEGVGGTLTLNLDNDCSVAE